MAELKAAKDLQELYDAVSYNASFNIDYTMRADELKSLIERIAKAKEAWETMRDSILFERDSLAESGLTSDQVNDVLGVVDDHYPFALAARSKPQEENDAHLS